MKATKMVTLLCVMFALTGCASHLKLNYALEYDGQAESYNRAGE